MIPPLVFPGKALDFLFSMPSWLKGQAPSDPSNTSLISGPLGYQGSKAARRVISEADVVLAVGTRSEKGFF